MQVYVKCCSNYLGGMPLMSFQELSETWTGDSLFLPFGQELDKKEVVGWTDLLFGSPCPVHIARVRTHDSSEGFLVYGGNNGLRVLDEHVESRFDHLPNGFGMPFIWVEHPEDLPEDVRTIVDVQMGS